MSDLSKGMDSKKSNRKQIRIVVVVLVALAAFGAYLWWSGA